MIFRRIHTERMLIAARRVAARAIGLICAAVLLSSSPGFVLGASPTEYDRNWPQWRGPLATGVAPLGDPPTTWSETENIRWKVALPGSGTATPIIWGDQIFLQTAIPTGVKIEPPDQDSASNEEESAEQPAPENPPGRRGFRRGFGGEKPTEIHQFVLLCLDRRTGETLWSRVAREEVPHEGHHSDHGFSSSSPVTDGEHIFAYFGSRGLHCYDLAGDLKWSKDLGRMRTRASFGEGSSPALWGDVIVINWDHEDEDFIAAFDKTTGEELWRQPREEATSWSTPLVVVHDGREQVVTAAADRIRGYDLASGELIWECAGLTSNVIPSPVAADGVIYATSGFRGNALLAIRLGHTGDLTDTDAVIWSHDKNTPYVPSPVLYGDRLYFSGGNNGILTSFDVGAGEALFGPERLEGLQGLYASPVGAGDRIYCVGRNGTSAVLKNADALEVLAVNELGERIDASPAIVGRELYLRGHQSLYCIVEE